MTGLRPQLETKFSDVNSQDAKLENPAELFRYFPSVFVSVPYHAVHCIIAAKVQLKNQKKLHSPTEWASWIPPTPKKETPNPCAQAFTGAPGCQAESATGSRQCNSLQCSLVMAPAG